MVWKKLLRSGEGKKTRALESLIPEINALEPAMQALSDEDLQHKTVEFRERIDRGVDREASPDQLKVQMDAALNDVMLEAFAAAREAAFRTIGQRAYDVQLMGGACLHFGLVAEMKTGEGKTLTSVLPVYLNALSLSLIHI